MHYWLDNHKICSVSVDDDEPWIVDEALLIFKGLSFKRIYESRQQSPASTVPLPQLGVGPAVPLKKNAEVTVPQSQCWVFLTTNTLLVIEIVASRLHTAQSVWQTCSMFSRFCFRLLSIFLSSHPSSFISLHTPLPHNSFFYFYSSPHLRKCFISDNQSTSAEVSMASTVHTISAISHVLKSLPWKRKRRHVCESQNKKVGTVSVFHFGHLASNF